LNELLGLTLESLAFISCGIPPTFLPIFSQVFAGHL